MGSSLSKRIECPLTRQCASGVACNHAVPRRDVSREARSSSWLHEEADSIEQAPLHAHVEPSTLGVEDTMTEVRLEGVGDRERPGSGAE